VLLLMFRGGIWGKKILEVSGAVDLLGWEDRARTAGRRSPGFVAAAALVWALALEEKKLLLAEKSTAGCGCVVMQKPTITGLLYTRAQPTN
jgi:hypothetical protein